MDRYKVVDGGAITRSGTHPERQAKLIQDFLNVQAEEGWVYKGAPVIGEAGTVFILEKSILTRAKEKSRQSKSKT